MAVLPLEQVGPGLGDTVHDTAPRCKPMLAKSMIHTNDVDSLREATLPMGTDPSGTTPALRLACTDVLTMRLLD